MDCLLFFGTASCKIEKKDCEGTVMRIYCTEERHSIGGPGLFLLGRAEEKAEQLLKTHRGKVRLIYLDPPFRTGESFSMKIGKGRSAKTIRLYEDTLSDDEYTAWMRRILSACHELLDAKGSLYLHLDYRMSAKMRLLLDEIFGASNFMNEIIWTYKSGGRSKRYFPRKHDTILFYRKTRNVWFDIQAVGVPRGPERRNHMKRFVEADGRVGFSIRSNGKIYTYYEDSLVYPSDVWSDIEHLQQRDSERAGYATQKPEALLRRIIGASTKEGDLVMDLFSGSGTTAAVAAKMNRRFLVTDCSPIAAYILRKRLLSAAGTLNLFDTTAADLTLCYPPDQTDCTVDYVIERKGDKRILHLKSVAFAGSDYPLTYAAIGKVREQVFCPILTNCAPRLPQKATLPDDRGLVLQVTDAAGHFAFFTLE